MSTFRCNKCDTLIKDSPQGYTTECKHWPFKASDIGHRQKYPEPIRPEEKPPSMIAGLHYEHKQ